MGDTNRNPADGQDPAAQGGADPKEAQGNNNQGAEPSVQESFFQEYVERITNEQEALSQRLSNDKLSAQEKFEIDKRLFEIEKEQHRLGVNTNNKVDLDSNLKNLGLDTNPEAVSYLKEVTKDMSSEEIKGLTDFMTGFMGKVNKTPDKKPADISNFGGGNGGNGGGEVVGYQADSIVGEGSKSAKANLIGLLEAISQKG